ncbi:MAG: FAD-binding oxidoreductase [Gemmatimonadales bacterium]
MSTEAVAAAVRESNATRTPLRISGRSNWLTAGRPVRASRSLSLRDAAGVVGYVPGDLTITVRAGTSLSEIERVTREHDQWLPLDPYGSNDGTIGATIATASAGPLATHFGLPRDLVLGLEFVNGRGDVVRAGGKVVKNVAGFDLCRLITGSWGSLGVITELTLRLYARPKVDRSVVIRLKGSVKESTEFLRAVVAAPLNPYSLELLGASATQALGLGSTKVCLIRFGGNAAAVDAQVRELSSLAKSEEVETAIWDRLRNLEKDAGIVIRISGLPSTFRAVSPSMLADEYSWIFEYVNPVRGVLRLVIHDSGRAADDEESLRGIDPAGGRDEHIVFEKSPDETWAEIPSAVSDPLSQGIKKAYDPHNILNPGILGD